MAVRTLKVFALFAMCLVFGLLADSSRTSLAQSGPPNIIFILADDLDASSVAYMPALQSLLVEEGTSFENAFVTTSLCCPSRASILTGQYTHNHQVLSNEPPNGGSEKFREMGHEESTVATWLRSGGYRTVHIGKYLNDYEEADLTYVPPGWDEWYALVYEKGLAYYGYRLNENGTVVSYGEDYGEEVQARVLLRLLRIPWPRVLPRVLPDYQTDVLARKAADYVRRVPEDGRPFFMHLTPRAPHSPYTPAPRHVGKFIFADVRAPRPPSFNEEDVSDKPSWVRSQPRLRSEQITRIDEVYRNRLRMMLAVDEMISGLIEALRESGELENTYIVFTSDNGYHMGEHRLRLRPDKRTVYEEDIRVPLVVRGPGVPAGESVDRFALNIDLAPTFAELARVPVPPSVDGRSLVPLLTGDPPPTTWRSAFLVERWATEPPKYRTIPSYKAVRTEGYKYVRYDDGDRELYNLRVDPYELENSHKSADPARLNRLKSRLEALRECVGASCRAAEDGP